jgi:hypothetical protein
MLLDRTIEVRDTILFAVESDARGVRGDVDRMMTKLLRVGGCVLTMVLGVGMAQGQQTADAVTPGGTTVLLWPNGAPGSQGNEDVDKPTLTVYLPSGANATKTGVVIAPGGGYEHLAMGYEGSPLVERARCGGVCVEVPAWADVSQSY